MSYVLKVISEFLSAVPRTVEGELKVDNEEFTAELQDPESNEYREFVNTFSDGLKRALFDRASQEDNEITIEIIQLRYLRV